MGQETFKNFQTNVTQWVTETFGEIFLRSKDERMYRFAEEGLELIFANGMTRKRMHEMVDWIWDKNEASPLESKGELAIFGEIRDTLVCLAAMASCHNVYLSEAAQSGLKKAWENQERIRERLDNKPAKFRGHDTL